LYDTENIIALLKKKTTPRIDDDSARNLTMPQCTHDLRRCRFLKLTLRAQESPVMIMFETLS
jgi:hypothetical protein